MRIWIFATALLLAAAASAQDTDGTTVETLDVTMKLMPEGASLPEAVTRIIELPPAAADTARENADRGVGEANAASENRQNGLDRAAQASEQGREQAQEVRENLGRAGPAPEPPGPPDLPGDRPGPGGPSDPPGPPGN